MFKNSIFCIPLHIQQDVCNLMFCIQQTSHLKRVCSTTDAYIIYIICNISIALFWFISHECHDICNIYNSVSFNRYCILNEVWRLVADGILNVTDIDNVMSEGLGMRYAFLGPLETAHLNAEGMREWFFTPWPPYNSNSVPISQMSSHIPMPLKKGT